MKRIWVLFLCVLCVTVSAAENDASQAICALPDNYVKTRPPPLDKPTQVNLDFYVIDIENVDSVKQQYTIDFVSLMTWNDPRLRQKVDKCQFKLGDVWNPALQLFNMRNVKKDLPEIVEVNKAGRVRYVQRYYGTLSSIFDLKNFPHDKQVLPISFVAFGHTTADIKLKFNKSSLAHMAQFALVDWNLISTDYSFDPLVIKVGGGKQGVQRNIAKFELMIHVERKLDYYLWKVLVPLSIIVFMSWSIFWLRPTEKAQIGIATTSVLASIAYLFVLNRFLPPISYLTQMDYFVFITMAQILMAFVVAVIMTASKLNDNIEFGVKFSKVCRVIFPIMYLMTIGIFFF